MCYDIRSCEYFDFHPATCAIDRTDHTDQEYICPEGSRACKWE